MDDRRVEVVQVRCSPGEKLAWQEAASRRGISVSELLREALNGGLAAGDAKGGAGPESRPASPAASSRKCVREARHHINHSGRPCEVCGYPGTRGAAA